MMPKFTQPNYKLVEYKKDEAFGKFAVDPLERGLGITLGNAMRRVLLACIPGVAIHAVKIEGVVHEFAAIPGVTENAQQIILNLKGLHIAADFNIINETDPLTLTLRVKHPGEIYAKDIQCPVGISIANPDHYLATLAKGYSLEIEMYAQIGRGYKTSAENSELIEEVGLIATDSKYSPIENVAYHITPTKIGRSGDFEQLTLEIKTNNTILPGDALAIAAKILTAHLELFVNLNEKITSEGFLIEEKSEKIDELDYSIEELDFTVRSYNCLRRAGIQTLRDLTEKTEDELMAVRNLGQKSFNEIRDKLHQMGLSFKQPE